MHKERNNRYLYITVGLIYISVFCFCLANMPDKWYFDAEDYWQRGELLLADWRSFSGRRGSIFPLYLGICNKLGNKIGFYAVNSALVAVLFAVFLPSLVDYRIDSAPKMLKPLITFGIIVFLFSGLFIFPLSDLFALFCATAALFCLQRFCNAEKVSGFVNLYAVACGIFLYAGYNTRTIYLFFAFAIIGYILFWKRKISEKAKLLSFILIGCLLAAIPQMLINWNEHRLISPTVITDGLMLKQIFWGLEHQRYGTCINEADFMIRSTPALRFWDPVGKMLLQREGIEMFDSWGQFLTFFAKYPLELVGIYIRHFINMTLACWPEQYIVNLQNNKIGYAVICFLMFYLFLLTILSKSLVDGKYWWLAPILIPCICILPGAVESRFFVAMHIFVVMCLLYATDWKRLGLYCKENWFAVTVLTILIGGLMVSTWSGMLLSEQFTPLFFR